MSRFCLLLVAALLLPSSIICAQTTADSIDATVKSKSFSFTDTYQFLDYSTALTGELLTGGITTTADVTTYTPEIQTKTVTKYSFQIVNGRISIVPTQVQKQVTVYVPSTTTQEVTLPEITGAWYSLGGTYSLWLINSKTTSDLVWGYGIRNGSTIYGFVIYISMTSPVPTGIYYVNTAPAAL